MEKGIKWKRRRVRAQKHCNKELWGWKLSRLENCERDAKVRETFFTISFKFSAPLRFPPSLTFKFFIFKSSLAERKELKLEWNWRIKNYHNLITHMCLCSKREKSEKRLENSAAFSLKWKKEDLRIFHEEISLLNKRICEKNLKMKIRSFHINGAALAMVKTSFSPHISSSFSLTDCKA